MSPSTVEEASARVTPRGRGDVGDARGDARGQRVQQVLDRRRAVVRPDQHRRVVGVEGERLPVGHLLLGPVEAVDRRLVVGPVEPAVGGPELELGEVGIAFHGVERGEQRSGVDAVTDDVLDGGHGLLLNCGPASGGLERC
jgi:hypothetical protein